MVIHFIYGTFLCFTKNIHSKIYTCWEMKRISARDQYTCIALLLVRLACDMPARILLNSNDVKQQPFSQSFCRFAGQRTQESPKTRTNKHNETKKWNVKRHKAFVLCGKHLNLDAENKFFLWQMNETKAETEWILVKTFPFFPLLSKQ